MIATEGGQEKLREGLVKKTKEELVGGLREKNIDEQVIEPIGKSKDELVEELIEKPIAELVEGLEEGLVLESIDKSSDELVEIGTKELKEKSVGDLIEKQIEELVLEPIDKPVEKLVKEPKEKLTGETIGELIEKQIEALGAEPVEKPLNQLAEEKENPIETLEAEQKKDAVQESIEEIIEKPIKESTEEEIIEEIKEKPTEEIIEKPIEESKEGIIKKLRKTVIGRKKIVRGIIISFSALLIIYLGMTKYFTNHFYFGSKIYSVNVSGKTVEDAKKAMESYLQSYTMTLKERNNKSEQIKASDVELKCNLDEEINKLKEGQNPFKWILAPFATKDSKMTVALSYDEKLLKEQVDKRSCFNSDNIVEPKNPSFQYQDNSYVIADEVPGSKVDKENLYTQVVNSMLKGESEIDLESLGCYINPQYNSKSEKTIEVKDTLNKFISSKITYTFGEKKETLDGSTINKWLKVDDNFQVTFDEEKVAAYIDGLAEAYDTVGKPRPFVTSAGITINIDGGDYGWAIDREQETQNLIKDIQEGKTITKQPVYSQTTPIYGNNDIGNTYVEVDLSRQHLWFYKNGSLVVQGDVVTGTVSTNHGTPKGVYRLKYKERNAILKGPGYACPVSYWMPFNQDIGIHDATWRSAFGGNIYYSNGSHGCVNSPYYLASTIFNNIEPNTPVVCHY